jgi:hypothetical protein
MTKRHRKSPAPPATGPALHLFAGLRDWHLLCLGALLVFVFFHEIIFRTSFFWEDFLLQFYPFRTFATVSFAQGHIPLWNPYTFCGMPFAADITGTVFYLPHVLLIPAVSGGRLSLWWFEMFIVLHFVLAAASMFFCGKSFGLSRIPAAFSALVYTFSGFMITHTIHTVVIAQAAWFPLALLLFKKTLDEESTVPMILSGFVLSMIVCGGHIQITLYFFVFLFAFFLLEMVHGIRERRRRGEAWPMGWGLRTTARAAGVVILAIGLSAIQILPTMELSGLSVREDFTFARTTEGQLAWSQLITVVIPKFFGASNALGMANPTPYWGPEASWNFWETCIYIGVAALTLSLFAAIRFRFNRHVAFMGGFALFSLLFALGDNFIIHGVFYQFVPGFNRFRDLGRWGFFLSLSGALLSGFGLQGLLGDEGRAKLFPRILITIAAIPIAVLVAVKTRLLDSFMLEQIRSGALRYDPPGPVLQTITEMAVSQIWISVAIALASSLVLYFFWRKLLSAAPAVLALFAVQFADMYIFGFAQNNGKTNPDDYFNERRPLVNRLLEEGKKEFFRVNVRNGNAIFIDRNQGLMDRIFLTEGYTQLGLKRRYPPASSADALYRLLNTKYRVFPDTVPVQGHHRVQYRFDPDTAYLPRAFMVYHGHVVTSADRESALLADPLFNPREAVFFEEDPGLAGLDTIPSQAWTARIDSYDINGISLSVSTPKKGILVLSEIYYPGWIAAVDGVPTHIFRADWSLRALMVDAGEHTVQLRFEPASFRNGATVSATCLTLSAAGLLLSFWRRRRKQQTLNPGGPR